MFCNTDLLELACWMALLEPHQHPIGSSGYMPETGTLGPQQNTEVRVTKPISGFGLVFGMLANSWLAGNRERIHYDTALEEKGSLQNNFVVIVKVLVKCFTFLECKYKKISNYAYCFLYLQLAFTLRSLESNSSYYLITQKNAARGVWDSGQAVCPVEAIGQVRAMQVP